MTPKKFSKRFISHYDRESKVNAWPIWDPVERRTHLEELGFRSNGLRSCQRKGCTATYEEWLTPEGDKRELDQFSLVPHEYTCTLSQKAPLTAADIAAIPLLAIGFLITTLIVMGGYFGPRWLDELGGMGYSAPHRGGLFRGGWPVDTQVEQGEPG